MIDILVILSPSKHEHVLPFLLLPLAWYLSVRCNFYYVGFPTFFIKFIPQHFMFMTILYGILDFVFSSYLVSFHIQMLLIQFVVNQLILILISLLIGSKPFLLRDNLG